MNLAYKPPLCGPCETNALLSCLSWVAKAKIRYVLCLRSWGFLVDDDDDEDEIIIDENGCIVEPVDGVVPVMVDLEAE